MPHCNTCNLCDKPGTFDSAIDIATVPCNVRRYQTHHFTVWRCINCGSIHCREDADLDVFYRAYPLHLSQRPFASDLTNFNRLRLMQRQGLKRTSRILDFGCGAGHFVDFLHRHGYRNAVGFDAFVSRYSDRNVLSIRHDFVVSYDVIEHADDPSACLTELAGTLEPGGVLVIGTPNADHVSLQQRPFAMELHQPYHRHILSEKALVHLARTNALEPVRVDRRFYTDTVFPGVNSRFAWAYAQALGGVVDVFYEPFRARVLLRSPAMLFLMYFGYFLPNRGSITISFRKQHKIVEREAQSANR